MTSLSNIDLKPLISKETNARIRIRLIALSHIQAGTSQLNTLR
jgi:hypothetical protein